MFILSTSLSQNGSTIFSMFQKIRGNAIGATSMSTSLAMGVACIIIVFMMIKLSHDIMSDEQQAGFGGVRLWTILRPVVILILIQSCSIWVGALDGVTNTITTSVAKGTSYVSGNKVMYDAFKLQSQVNEAANPSEEFTDADLKSSYDDAEKKFSDYMNSLETTNPSAALLFKLITLRQENSFIARRMKENAVKDAALSKGMDEERIPALKTAVRTHLNGLSHMDKESDGKYSIKMNSKNFIPAVCNWLYDRLYVVIQCVAEILLMILALCAPWVLVLSLMGPWRNAIGGFIGSYIQISFWKVVAGVINMATVTFRTGAVKFMTDQAQDNILSAANNVDIISGNPDAAIILSAIVSVAGVFCLLKIQDITAAIIPAATNLGGASGGASTAFGGIKTTASVTKTVATGIATGGKK